MKAFLGVLMGLFFFGWATGRAVNGIRYGQDCGGHLKRAADANTIKLAQQELAVVLKYLDDHRMTNGYTSILWQTPDEDIGFWYENLRAASDELDSVEPSATQLERTNVLMKLRETLLDGTSITEPMGISVYPHNGMWTFFGVVSLLLGIVGCVLIVMWVNDRL